MYCCIVLALFCGQISWSAGGSRLWTLRGGSLCLQRTQRSAAIHVGLRLRESLFYNNMRRAVKRYCYCRCPKYWARISDAFMSITRIIKENLDAPVARTVLLSTVIMNAASHRTRSGRPVGRVSDWKSRSHILYRHTLHFAVRNGCNASSFPLHHRAGLLTSSIASCLCVGDCAC